MPTTPPPDNKQEQVSETPDAAWGDSCEHYYPNGKDAGAALKRLLAKLDAYAREKNKVGDVVRVYGSEDWIREHLSPFSREPYTFSAKICVNLQKLCIDNLCNMPYNRTRKRGSLGGPDRRASSWVVPQ